MGLLQNYLAVIIADAISYSAAKGYFMPYEDLIRVVVVFLLPIVPAVMLFSVVPPKEIDADVNGAIAGLSFKAGGATAVYVILVMVASFIYNMVVNEEVVYAESGLKIRLIGDEHAVENFKTQVRSDIEVSFISENSILASHSGFRLDPFKDLLTSTNFRFDRDLIGKPVDIQLDPFQESYSITPNTITLQEGEMALTMTLSNQTGGDWISSLDIDTWEYSSGGAKTKLTHLQILDNRTEGTLSNIHLNPIDTRFLSFAVLTAYEISEASRLKLLELWSRPNTQGRGAEEILALISETTTELKSLTQITSEQLDKDELADATLAEPALKLGARFLFGITPRIEQIRGGISPGKSIAVVLEVERDASDYAEFKLPTKPETQTVGRRYIYPTELATFAVLSSDDLEISDDAISRQFLTADGGVQEYGDPILRDTSSGRITELQGVPGDSTLLTRFYWKP